MKDILLNVSEVAELECVKNNTIYVRIKRNSVEYKQEEDESSKKTYLIKLSSLSEKAQARYYKKNKIDNVTMPAAKVDNPYEDITLEELTKEQRNRALQWEDAIISWRKYVEPKRKEKAQATEDFVTLWNELNEFKIPSVRTLQRKWQLYKDFGIIAIADHRKQSSRKDVTEIHVVLESIFLQWWLDEAKPCVSTVYRTLKAYCEMDKPDLLPVIPSENSFYRLVKKVPYPVLQYFREGSKAFDDTCMPYLRKIYEYIDSNDVWQSDYHTLDIMVRDDITGEVYRPHIAAWIDVRSRKILSIHICKNSTSDGVIIAFRKAAELYGLPNNVYLDNGREYLVHDFGGRGRRKTDKDAEYGSSILERCGVKMHNAKVQNGKTKVIERIFRDVKNDFSKLITSYVGGRPEERPERMKKQNKDLKNVPLLSEVRKQLEVFVEGIYNNHVSTGEFMAGRTPNQSYADNLIVKRVATPDQLNLLLLRNERLQMVQRNGVYVRYGDLKVYYYSQLLAEQYQREKVYVRYDPEQMEEVRIYDEREVFICTAKRKMEGGHAFEGSMDKESMKELAHQKKAVKRSVQRFMENLEAVEEVPEIMEIVTRKAQMMLEENQQSYDAKIIVPMEFNPVEETSEVKVDLSRMVANAMRNQA